MSDTPTIPIVYLNGQLLPRTEASVSIDDPGFLHGASSFTTMRTHNGVVFGFEHHLARLGDTVTQLGLVVGATTRELYDNTYAVLDANGLREARIRITLTPGTTTRGATTLITADALPDYPAEWYTDGIAVTITAMKQHADDPIFGLKTGCYLPRLLARQQAAAASYADALWFSTDNYLAESCFSNIFLVTDNDLLLTPPLDTPVLPGILRETVIQLARELGLELASDQPLTIHDLLGAKEVFLTSSCMGIRPVVTVEQHTIGNGKPGPITQQIATAYATFLDEVCRERPTLAK
jgi:branched-chain amino acid aminotransferase